MNKRKDKKRKANKGKEEKRKENLAWDATHTATIKYIIEYP